MRALGIDLSTDPSRTAACLIDTEHNSVELLSRPLDDVALVAAIGAADVAGIDAPLGWPDAFVDAVGAHAEGKPWPPSAGPVPGDQTALRLRATDLAVQTRTGVRPLSVSTDRLGATAMRAAHLQTLLREAGVEVDRTGTAGRLVEVYPAAALRAWGLASTGYKGIARASERRALVAALVGVCGTLAVRAEEVLDGAGDDDLDAFVAALVALAARRGLTESPTAEESGHAAREGWIHVPTGGPATVIAGM